MGWPPAVVIVVRHGARLDAADKQWHLTSPTPYDPPLTYGGWTQSKALGARIAAILRSRETDDEIPETNEGEEKERSGDRRKRRHKVIIHTSPFLRCVQTSVAIAAGLGQNPGHTYTPRPSSARSNTPTQLHSSPKIRPTVATGSPRLGPISEPSLYNGKAKQKQDHIKKSIIRVDAFLGEWLSPDYFELITPPPSSIMMVAGAKADLLRREDYSNLMQAKPNANQGFPGGWGSPVVLAKSPEDEGSLSNLSSLGQALPRRDRTSSLSSVGSGGSRTSNGKASSSLNGSSAAEHGIYQPPVPHYSISSSDPIPPGYVAHARDACVNVDYQWDSMREPQDWGNGGEYGEEWSSMHKRFRKGLQQLIQWYSYSDEPDKVASNGPPTPPNDDGDDGNTDLVIILVTHGAGCNALIGALTAQPVLLDVGMSSLTMAVRKPTHHKTPTSTPGTSRVSSRTLNIADEYDVKLVANTEHLRSTSSTPSSSRTPSISGISAFRERFGVPGVPAQNGMLFGGGPVRSNSTSAGLGSIRRTNSIATASLRSYVPTRQSSIGLWSHTRPEEEEEDLGSSMVLDFGGDSASPASPVEAPPAEETKTTKASAVVDEERDEADDVAPLGLWGSPRPPGDAERLREVGPKRRWTVNERTSAA